MNTPDVTEQPKAPTPVACSGLLAVVAVRNLTRRETVNCNAYHGYTKDFHYLQYQTSDGKWHDVPNAFEDITAETANDKAEQPASAEAELSEQCQWHDDSGVRCVRPATKTKTVFSCHTAYWENVQVCGNHFYD